MNITLDKYHENLIVYLNRIAPKCVTNIHVEVLKREFTENDYRWEVVVEFIAFRESLGVKMSFSPALESEVIHYTQLIAHGIIDATNKAIKEKGMFPFQLDTSERMDKSNDSQ